ncbi:DUF4012 domain-containing protein [Nocardioides sp. B-3]|uniref:DUF4012 domain-containing protein n=1 Tax=Nocardioides sp. B-3 TaxID=2895565 RepID=UPI002152C1C5|nr:DUF4012 domain-containing protein [Nocardioides sp. B-3]UUZ57666.1 DUF4012 domain-containing protein [Nocardioides sp. B-3]
MKTLAPLADVLPDLLGKNGRRDYLIAILNPAEQLYSGGTPLTFTPMSVRDGRIDMGVPRDTATHGAAFLPRTWPKVRGNPFHHGALRIGTATFAPDWSVSGEETLRAWRSLGRKQMDGLIAIDVMALRDPVAITGPMQVPFYGEVNADNFVQTLIGSYDYILDSRGRHAVNRALVPIFRDRLFRTGQFVEKLRALKHNADGRHFALYLRGPGRTTCRRAPRPHGRALGHRPRLSRGLHPERRPQQDGLLAEPHRHLRRRAEDRRQRIRHGDHPDPQRLDALPLRRPRPAPGDIRPGSPRCRSRTSSRGAPATCWAASTTSCSSRSSTTSTVARSYAARFPSSPGRPVSSRWPTTCPAPPRSRATS